MGKTTGRKQKAAKLLTPQDRVAEALKAGADNTTKKHVNDIFLTKECSVAPAQMFVDTDYQRNPAERMAMHRKILAEGFNLNRAEPMHIHIRKNKDIVILDGGGRWYIMKYLLNMDNTPVKCLDHPFIKTIEEEVEVYLDLNSANRMKVNLAQKHKARMILGEEASVEMDAEANEGGLTILGGGKNRIPYAAAETLHHWGVLRRVGEIKLAAWPKTIIDSWLYMAVGAILKACPTIKEKQLVEVLIDNPPIILHGKIKEIIGFGKPHARNMPPKMAQVILMFYNKRKSANRVEPEWSRVDKLCLVKPYSDRWGWYIKDENIKEAAE